MGASEGLFSVQALLGQDVYQRDEYPGIVDSFYLVGDPTGTGSVPFDFGGQGGECPRRYVVSLEQARACTVEFFRTGAPDIAGGGWERDTHIGVVEGE